MKPEEKLICDFTYSFVKDNWSKIDKFRCGLPDSKEVFLKKVKEDVQTAIWVITEVANWSMDKTYLRDIYQELPEDTDFRVWKIDNKYIKLYCETAYDKWEINFTKPKIKKITYFE